MKKAIVICLLLVAVCAWGEWDWYGFFFDDPPVGEEYYVIGTVFDVYFGNNVWVVIVFTSYEVSGHFLQSPVMLWLDKRPIVNDGDTVEINGTYSGLWNNPGSPDRKMPTFKVIRIRQ